MLQARGDANLVEKTLLMRRRRRQWRCAVREHLHGNLPLMPQVIGPVDGRHASARNPLAQYVSVRQNLLHQSQFRVVYRREFKETAELRMRLQQRPNIRRERRFVRSGAGDEILALTLRQIERRVEERGRAFISCARTSGSLIVHHNSDECK